MRRLLLSVSLALGCVYGASGQNYLSAVGNPSFGVNIPIPNGYINIANGNLHMEVPLSQVKQRGALSLNERLVYDSRIWEIIHYSGYYWWPLNVPNSAAGWRFIQGNEIGSIAQAANSISNLSCYVPNGGYSMPYQGFTLYYSWTDPSGTIHTFDAGWYYSNPAPYQCTQVTNPPVAPMTVSGYATDASGYSITLSGNNNAPPTSFVVTDSTGTQVYPQVADRFGNSWSKDANGNLVDDVGRTPVIQTVVGNQTYFDVLAPNGSIQNNGTRVRYTMTTEQIPITTAFNQSGVTEYQNNNNPPKTISTVQSIGLPDGSSYNFTYDSYGEVQTITLPTGGLVTYGWSNYKDSYQNVNRWLSSSTIDGYTTTYTPSVVTNCSSGGTGCQEQVNLHRPSGDETLYTLTLNNGAWNTNSTIYSGTVTGGKALASSVNKYDFSHTCNSVVCTGAEDLTRSYETDTLLDANLSTQIQTSYAAPQTGQQTSWAQWDYFSAGSTPSTLPTRQTNYGYTGFNLTSETDLDSQGNSAATTSYNYSGPYLNSVTSTSNVPSTTYTTYSTYNPDGSVKSTQDAKGNPATSYKYDSTDTYVTEIDRPDTVTNGVTFHHVSKSTYDLGSGAILSSDDENSVAHGQAFTTKYIYEPIAGRLHSVSHPDGGSETYTYTTYTSTSPAQTSVATLQSTGVSLLSSRTVDGYGRPSKLVTGSRSVTKGYDSNGRFYSVTSPEMSARSSTDGTTTTQYDALNRITSTTNPDSTGTSVTYVGNTATSRDEVGSQRKGTSNAFGELISVLEPDPVSGSLVLETDYQHDALGNVICIEQHGNVSGTGCSSSFSSDASTPWRVRRFFYNSLSQLIAAKIPEHTSSSANIVAQQKCAGVPNGPWTDCYGYDPNGNQTTIVDNRGVTRSFGFDQLDRLTTETSPGVSKARTYDAGTNGLGHPAILTNGAFSTSYAYDVMGRETTEQECYAGYCAATSGSYDLAGNLATITYPDGRVISNTYDPTDNLPKSVFQSSNGQPVGTPYWSAPTYAGAGQLVSAQLGTAVQLQAGFNNRQSLTSLAYNSVGASPRPFFNKTYQWDSNAVNLIGETNNITSQLRQYQYDKMNRLYSAADFSVSGAPSTATATISGAEGSTQDCTGGLGTSPAGTSAPSPNYTPPGGCITAWDTGNVTITVGGYTASAAYGKGSTSLSLTNALISMLNASGSPVTASVSGGVITMTAKVMGAAGNYALSTYSDGDFNAALSGTTLTGGVSANPLPGGLNQAYSMDPWGNLTSTSGSGFPQSVNNANQVPGYLYDASGRVTKDGGRNTYTWGDDGLLLGSSDGTQYIYDALGQRVRWTNGGSDKNYLYFGGRLMATYVFGTNTFTDMIYAGGAKIGEVGPGGAPVFDLTNQVGTAVAAVDANGNVLSGADYAPYGQLLSGSPASNFQFTGLERDGDGLDHAQWRQYSSASARWLTPDPYDGSYSFTDPQSFNRYGYVGARPLAFTDPSGLRVCDGSPADTDGPCSADSGFIGQIIDFFDSIPGWFSHPSFHGSLKSRPNVRAHSVTGPIVAQPDGTYTMTLNVTEGIAPVPDVPLDPYAAAVFAGVAQQTAGFPDICTGGAFVYAGAQGSPTGGAHAFGGYLGNYDSRTGFSHNFLIEGSGNHVGVGGVFGSQGVEGLLFVPAAFEGGALGGLSKEGLAFGLYLGTPENFPLAAGGGAYANLSTMGSCRHR